MNIIKITIGLAISAFSFEIAAATVHTVESGDTLYAIASRYHVPIEKLRDVNNLSSFDIRTGQRLSIPSLDKSRVASSTSRVVPSTNYVVRKGDTLSSVAQRYRVSLPALKSVNHLRSSVVQIGQKLTIPSTTFGSSNIAASSVVVQKSNITQNDVHVVATGDTLSAIATSYGVGLSRLAQFNGLSLRKPLQQGQKIQIPGSSVAKNTATIASVIPAATNRQLVGARAVRLESASAIVVDAETGKILYAKNIDTIKPIASITKLMTAMVSLDAKLPLNEVLKIDTADLDSLKHTTSRLPVGTQLSRYEMMRLALMSSENRAASALSRHYPGGRAEFIKAMNKKAQMLGMSSTQFFDPTGLTPHNTSTASDLVKMVEAASHYDLIHKFTTTEGRQVAVHSRGAPLQYINSNVLVRNGQWDIEVSKTGYINEAGRCLVMKADVGHRPSVMVLLDSNGKYSPVGDATRIKKWIESGAAGIKLASL